MRKTISTSDIVGLSEIASIYTTPKLPVSRQLANRWAEAPGFPEPVRALRQGRLWSAERVGYWVAENRPEYFEAAAAAKLAK
jgi:hypothetical protein